MKERQRWSGEEDALLRAYVRQYGPREWHLVSQRMNTPLDRDAKSCLERWKNYLKPGIKKGSLTEEEQRLVIRLQAKHGNKWKKIAAEVPGRTAKRLGKWWEVYKEKQQKKELGNRHGCGGNNSRPIEERKYDSILETFAEKLVKERAFLMPTNTAATTNYGVGGFLHPDSLPPPPPTSSIMQQQQLPPWLSNANGITSSSSSTPSPSPSPVVAVSPPSPSVTLTLSSPTSVAAAASTSTQAPLTTTAAAAATSNATHHHHQHYPTWLNTQDNRSIFTTLPQPETTASTTPMHHYQHQHHHLGLISGGFTPPPLVAPSATATSFMSELADCCRDLEEGHRAWAAHKKEASWRLKRVELQLESEKSSRRRELMDEIEAKVKALREEERLALERIDAEYREQLAGLVRDAEAKEHKLADHWANKHLRLSKLLDRTGCRIINHQ